MKFLTVSTFAACMTLTLALFAQMESAQAATISGQCKLEASRKTFALQPVDPTTHFGMIAEGFSPNQDRVYLTVNLTNFIDIHIQSANGSGYAIFPISGTGSTPIRFGVFLLPNAERPLATSEWLSCNLQIAL